MVRFNTFILISLDHVFQTKIITIEQKQMIMTTHLGDETGKRVLVDLYGLNDAAYVTVDEVLQLIYIMELTKIKGF